MQIVRQQVLKKFRAMSSPQQTDSPPYSVHIDPSDALQLLPHGASILLLNFPPNFRFGLDLRVFSVGPRFKGMKLIPPGPHFVYYSVAGKHGNEFCHFTGFFIHPCAGEVIVRTWDSQEEQLVKLSDSNEEERYQLAVKNLEFDRQLGTYDLHRHRSWRQLTSYLSAQTIERFEPVGGDISVIAEADFVDNQSKTPAEKRLHEHLMKSKESGENKFPLLASGGDTSAHVKETSGRCFYTRVPHLVRLPGATGAELTAVNVDKSTVLESLLKQQYKGSEDLLLGELQFAFIAFLMGQSLESFSQWKSIVCLLLSCEEAPLRTHTRFFVKFLEVLCFQLKASLKCDPSDAPFLDDTWFSEDHFLRFLFKEFYRLVIDAQPVDGDLLRHTRKLKSILEASFGWILDSEDGDIDEYAPVIVPQDALPCL